MVSSWNPLSVDPRLETTAASSAGNDVTLIHALSVMLPGQLKTGGIAEICIVVDAVQAQRVAVFACRASRAVGERADKSCPMRQRPSCRSLSSNAYAALQTG